MNIGIGKVYKSKRLGENVVVVQKLNSTGSAVYAGVTDSGILLWFGGDDLIEHSNLLPVQEDLVNSEKKRINIIACGRGVGTTTAFFYNIINQCKDAVIICNSYKHVEDSYKKFIGFLHNVNSVGCFSHAPREKVIYFSNYKVSFKIKHSVSSDCDVYYNYNVTKDRALVCPSRGNLYFRCLPSDLISGYKTTTDNGYYEVKQCDNPLLKFVINESGKIPKATPTKIEQFLKAETNLITGYNYTSNKHLPSAFGEAIESLDYSDNVRMTGSWVKL